MHVVATAGHVDHGKSTLVRALTGTDPDRLEEERERGLSIALGYAWTSLDEVGEVAFVDVPGHERFVSTTLSGLGPVGVALLVVAADDPWMPQAAEHLAALDALGVSRGLVVVTRSDLVDPGPALDRARAEVARTSMRDVDHVVVSGRTGAGLDALRTALRRVLADVPAPDADADVRLWVDRRFHVRGAGTVVTGTLPAGTVAVGDVLAWRGHTVRVRGVEALGSPREAVAGVARVALDLAGSVPDELGPRTPLVTPDAFALTDVVEVEITVGPALVDGARLPDRPLLHVGSARTEVHARPLDARFVRLTLPTPLPLRVGDRAILRDSGSRALWGVRVVDPAPPALGRRGAAAARAGVLASDDGTVGGELARRRIVRRSFLRRIGVLAAPASGSADLPPGAVVAGDWLLDPAEADRVRTALVEQVTARDPAAAPLSATAVARTLGLPDAALVEALVTAPLALVHGHVVDARRTGLAAPLADALAALTEALRDDPFAAPAADQLDGLGLDPATVAALHRTGQVLRLAENVVLLPVAPTVALARLRALPEPFTVSEARQALATSRRVALPLLRHLDASGLTVRLADDRRRIARGTG